MKITEMRYRDIYRNLPSHEDQRDTEWRRRGFTVKRKRCGCVTADREVVGVRFTSMSLPCIKHATEVKE